MPNNPFVISNPNKGHFLDLVNPEQFNGGLVVEPFESSSASSASNCNRSSESVEVDEIKNEFLVGGDLKLTRICPHNGCPLNVKKDGFECPCHASTFDKCGNCLKGPACPNSIRLD